MTPDRAARLHEAVDRQAGETFTYQPMAKADVNARPAADGSRAVQDFTATWVDPHVEANRRPRLDMAEVRQGGMRQVSAGRPAIKFTESALPYASAIGDRVLRQATSERFEVGDIAGDGFGRAVLFLTARGS